MPAEGGLPRNHTAEPLKGGTAVLIGISQDAEPLAVTTSPCAAPESAFTTSTVTRAPDFTVITGFTMPATRDVSPGPPEGRASTTKLPAAPEKVIRSRARSTVEPAGTSLPSLAASVALT